MSLLNKITVDQFQRIVSIEANSIYTISDKKIATIKKRKIIPLRSRFKPMSNLAKISL